MTCLIIMSSPGRSSVSGLLSVHLCEGAGAAVPVCPPVDTTDWCKERHEQPQERIIQKGLFSVSLSYFSSYTANTNSNSEVKGQRRCGISPTLWRLLSREINPTWGRNITTHTFSLQTRAAGLSLSLLHTASLSPPAYFTHSRVQQVCNTLTLIV